MMAPGAELDLSANSAGGGGCIRLRPVLSLDVLFRRVAWKCHNGPLDSGVETLFGGQQARLLGEPLD